MGHQNLFASVFSVKIQGSVVPDLDQDLLEVVVEDNLYLPDMFTIRLLDPKQKWVDSPLLEIGNKVEILTRPPGLQAKAPKQFKTLFIGEITCLEPEFTSGNAPVMQVRGYDLSHRLHQGKQTRSFLEMTDSEVAQKVAQDVGLKATVDPTQPIQEQITQNNQTNMEFLRELAQRNGYQLYVEDSTLHFRQGDQAQEGEDSPSVEWGLNLSEFQIRLAATHQVKEVIVRGWDPIAKKTVIGQANESKSYPDVPAVDQVKKAYPGTEQLVVSRPVKTQEEATAIAQAIFDEMAADFIRAEATALGDPRIKSGKYVDVSRIGQRFSGKYFVTLATHHYTLEQGYSTTFSVGGRKPETLTNLLAGASTEPSSLADTGPRVALVTQNKDPQGLGRVKVKFPTVSDTDESSWVRIASSSAGANSGFHSLPEINSEVLVAFEQGNIHRPYMLGSLWNSEEKPPIPPDAIGSDGLVNKTGLQSRGGNQITLNDTSGDEGVTIDTGGQFLLTASNSVLFSTDSLMRLDSQADMVLTSNQGLSNQAKVNINIESGKDVYIIAMGDMFINVTGELRIKASKISFN